MTVKRLVILVGGALLAVSGTIFLLQHRTLREQNQALRQQAEQLGQQAAKTDGAAGQPAAAPEDQLGELNRLRGEADAKRPTGDLAKLQAQNRRLRAATGEPEDPAEAEFKKQTLEQVSQLKVCGLDFHIYASRNNGQFPESWEQALSGGQKRSGLKDPAALESYLNNLSNTFEIVYRGNVSAITKPGETIVFRERQARQSPKGQWVKVYGFADGSTKTQTQPDENFNAWEQQHLFGAK